MLVNAHPFVTRKKNIMSSKIWVLVASSARAILFSAEDRGGSLHNEERWEDAMARLHDQDINTDRPGRSFDSHGEGRHAMEPRVDPKTEEAEHFARFVGEHLRETMQAQGGCERLHLIAAPEFLGHLRNCLDHHLQTKIVSEIPKDLVMLDSEDIRKHLPDFL
jgi:protein required for attachment to host cells